MISEETDNRPNPDHEGYDHVCPVCDQGYYGSYCEYCAELADATALTPHLFCLYPPNLESQHLSSVPVLAESRVDATHGKCDTIEDEALESTTKRPNPLGIGLDRPASDGHSSGATQSILDGGVEKSQETRWQNGKDIPEARGPKGTSPMRKVSGSTISLKQTSEGSVSPIQTPSTTFPVTKGASSRSIAGFAPKSGTLSTPSIVEAFYSQNQKLLQDWKVPYDNSLFVRLDQPGFIQPYFSLLRARNLIVP